MSTRKDALRGIITAIGGTPKGKTTSALLVQISESFQDATEDGDIVLNVIELPAVTSADNGKVLGVVNGEWAAMSVSSFLQDSSAN